MTEQKAQQAISDIERMAKTARTLWEEKKWMELAGMFDYMEQAAQRGFNQTYQLFNIPHNEPNLPESREHEIAAALAPISDTPEH